MNLCFVETSRRKKDINTYNKKGKKLRVKGGIVDNSKSKMKKWGWEKKRKGDFSIYRDVHGDSQKIHWSEVMGSGYYNHETKNAALG